jgi:hypothetical protein
MGSVSEDLLSTAYDAYYCDLARSPPFRGSSFQEIDDDAILGCYVSAGPRFHNRWVSGSRAPDCLRGSSFQEIDDDAILGCHVSAGPHFHNR